MKIITTEDGSHSILSERYGVSYHSKHGAIAESLHVFIDSGLHYHPITNKKEIEILEIGFGTGLNCLLSYIHQSANQIIHYTGIEANPIDQNLANHLNYIDLLGREFEEAFKQIHNFEWEVKNKMGSSFFLSKLKKRFEGISFEDKFDLIYFDAFAPSAQPELWKIPFLSIVRKACRKGAVLVTYCAQGQFKRNLRELGFNVEGLRFHNLKMFVIFKFLYNEVRFYIIIKKMFNTKSTY